MTFETTRWPFVQARWYKRVDPNTPRTVRVIVIHDMEFAETPNAAEVIANDFATRPEDQKASAHVCVDNNSVVQCVHDRDVAYAAPGCNNDGIQIELAGFGKQTREQWLDVYGVALLSNAADVVAQYCLKYDITAIHLTNEQLELGHKGIVGHIQVSEVYKLSDHTDPGPNFPWSEFMSMVVEHIALHGG